MKDSVSLIFGYVFATLVLVSLAISVYVNGLNGEKEFHRELREFLEAGPRNTAHEGFNLCLRIERLEAEQNIEKAYPPCREIYKSEGR